MVNLKVYLGCCIVIRHGGGGGEVYVCKLWSTKKFKIKLLLDVDFGRERKKRRIRVYCRHLLERCGQKPI